MKVIETELKKKGYGGTPAEVMADVEEDTLLCIIHNIVEDTWHEDIKGFICHYLQAFQQAISGATRPRVLIFFNVVCHKPETSMGKFMGLFNSLENQVKSCFDKIHKEHPVATVVLDRLESVKSTDINKWILDHLPDDPSFFNSRFGNQARWSMDKIEEILKLEITRIRKIALEQGLTPS